MSWLFDCLHINKSHGFGQFEGVFLWLIWVSDGVLFAPSGCLRTGRNNSKHSCVSVYLNVVEVDLC